MPGPHIIATVTNDLNYDQRMRRICSSLQSMNYPTLLCGRRKKDSSPLSRQNYAQYRMPCFFQKGKAFYLEYNLRLFFFLLWRKWDLVYAVDLDTLGPALLVARLKGKKCIYDAHEWFSETPEVERRPFIQDLWRWLARLTIPRADACITVGSALARKLGKDYGQTFAVVRNLPQEKELPQTLPAPDLQRPILLYQGALNEGRGLECCLEVLPDLPRAQLWLAGEGDLSEKLRTRALELEVKERVRFLGYVRPENLHNITLQATVGLNLLESRSRSYYFSLANKSFDYIQAGLPAIHMDFPEYRNLNCPDPVALLLPKLSPPDLLACLQSLFSNPEYYALLRKNCLRIRKELRWEKEEKKLQQIIIKYC